jgi:hypothetical protein
MYYHIDGGRDHGAGQLTSYIGRDDHQLRNRRGEPLDEEEREQFIERSKQYQYERQIIISPERGDELSRQELSVGARRSMREFSRDRPSAEYVYAVHQDTEHPHAQIAVTGQKSDLWTDQDDLDRLKERAREQFREKQRTQTRQRHEQRQQEREQQRERGHDRDEQRDRDRGRSRSGGRF